MNTPDSYMDGLVALNNLGVALDVSRRLSSRDMGFTTGEDPTAWLAGRLMALAREVCPKIARADTRMRDEEAHL